MIRDTYDYINNIDIQKEKYGQYTSGYLDKIIKYSADGIVTDEEIYKILDKIKESLLSVKLYKKRHQGQAHYHLCVEKDDIADAMIYLFEGTDDSFIRILISFVSEEIWIRVAMVEDYYRRYDITYNTEEVVYEDYMMILRLLGMDKD